MGYGFDDAVNHIGITHAGDTAMRANVRRHALKRHDGDGAGVFGDPRLFRRDHIHNHAALEHLRQAPLDHLGTFFILILLMTIRRHDLTSLSS